MGYQIALSRKFDCPDGEMSCSILDEPQDYLCKLYPGKGIDWAPGLTDAERNSLWEKHFDIKIISSNIDAVTVEFISKEDFFMYLLTYTNIELKNKQLTDGLSNWLTN